MAHSHSSSLADDYYAQYSPRSSVYSDQQPRTSVSPPPSQPLQVRKQTSLAHIAVPSFSSFRSQASSIPIASQRKPAPLFQPSHSPRSASFSLAEKASPRLADPSSRPLSLDSPLPQQPTGQANIISPPLTEAKQEDR